jgi:ribosomal subunit interface protein
MDEPVQITYRGMDRTDAIEAHVQEQITKLERYYDHIIYCNVVVEAPRGPHQHHGQLYDVRIEMGIPGEEIVVSHQGPKDKAHRDFYVAVRDAFEAARKQLLEAVQRQRRQVKSHAVLPHGRVTELFPERGYGFLEDLDGLQIYFHRNAVLNDEFDALSVGSVVRYVLAQGEGKEGPQASTVELSEP